jgi:acyl dehydratase
VVGQIAKGSMLNKIKAENLPSLINKKLEPSSWLEIAQDRVDQFSRVTNDFQLIHADSERGAKTFFEGPIVHGFLLLSLLPYLNSQHSIVPENLVMSINYGSDKVRYLAPVRVGKRVRSIQKIINVNEKKPGQWLIKKVVTLEIEGEKKLALLAEMLQMFIVES